MASSETSSLKGPEETKAIIERLKEEMDRITNDAASREEAEAFHRRISRIPVEDLFRPFDI